MRLTHSNPGVHPYPPCAPKPSGAPVPAVRTQTPGCIRREGVRCFPRRGAFGGNGCVGEGCLALRWVLSAPLPARRTQTLGRTQTFRRTQTLGRTRTRRAHPNPGVHSAGRGASLSTKGCIRREGGRRGGLLSAAVGFECTRTRRAHPNPGVHSAGRGAVLSTEGCIRREGVRRFPRRGAFGGKGCVGEGCLALRWVLSAPLPASRTPTLGRTLTRRAPPNPGVHSAGTGASLSTKGCIRREGVRCFPRRGAFGGKGCGAFHKGVQAA